MRILAQFIIPGIEGEMVDIGIAQGPMSGGADIPQNRVWVYYSNGEMIECYGYDEGLAWPEAKRLLVETIKAHLPGRDDSVVTKPASIDVKLGPFGVEVDLDV